MHDISGSWTLSAEDVGGPFLQDGVSFVLFLCCSCFLVWLVLFTWSVTYLYIYICNRFRRKKQNFLRLHWLCDGPLKGGCEDKNVDATRFMTCFYIYKNEFYRIQPLRAKSGYRGVFTNKKTNIFSMLSLFIGQINRTYAMCVLSITLYWPALKGSVYLGLVTLNYII